MKGRDMSPRRNDTPTPDAEGRARQLVPRAGRRAVLLGGAALLSGCASQISPTGPRATHTPDSPATHVPSPSPGPTIVPRPWSPGPGEVRPEVKVTACRWVERLGSDRGRVTWVNYPQYGGLLQDAASVMVIAEQEWTERGVVRGRGLTVDVRLAHRGGQWVVTSHRQFGRDHGRVADPTYGQIDERAALIADPRVDLPAAAEGDVLAGRVDSLVVRVLRRLSAEYRLSVSVFASGHPREVFGTDGMSNHARGRAVDVWAIDGHPVARMPLDGMLLRSFLARAARLGSDEVGGPIDPDGPGVVHFANQLHRDHIHIGFDI